jgi:hypothetical protein
MFLPARSRLCMFTMYVLETLVSFCHLICLCICEKDQSREGQMKFSARSCELMYNAFVQGLRRHKGYGSSCFVFVCILFSLLHSTTHAGRGLDAGVQKHIPYDRIFL